jgi:hypothetical protein
MNAERNVPRSEATAQVEKKPSCRLRVRTRCDCFEVIGDSVVTITTTTYYHIDFEILRFLAEIDMRLQSFAIRSVFE